MRTSRGGGDAAPTPDEPTEAADAVAASAAVRLPGGGDGCRPSGTLMCPAGGPPIDVRGMRGMVGACASRGGGAGGESCRAASECCAVPPEALPCRSCCCCCCFCPCCGAGSALLPLLCLGDAPDVILKGLSG